MTNRSEKLYTETLDPETRGTVARIAARRGKAFRTNAFQPPEMADGPWHRRWREARLDRRSDLWVVEEIRTVPSGNGATHAEKTVPVLAAVCFFDALYSCAAFESGQEDGSPAAGAPENTLPHYRAFGEREGLPFDEDTGLPVPAADGLRLGGGTFAPQARDIVARSEGNLAARAPERPALLDDIMKPEPAGALVPVGLGESGRQLDAFVKSKAGEALTLQQTRKILTLTKDAVDNLKRKFNDEVILRFSDRQGEDAALIVSGGMFGSVAAGGGGYLSIAGLSALFSSSSSTLVPGLFLSAVGGIGAVLGGLVLGAFGYMVLERLTPQGTVRFSMRILEENVRSLPDSPLKEEMTRLSHEVRQGFFALWFRHCCREALQTGGFWPRRRMNAARKHFIAACRKQGLDDAVTENRLGVLTQDIHSQTLDEELARRIERAMQETAKHLENMKNAEPDILKALPAPPPPPPPEEEKKGMMGFFKSRKRRRPGIRDFG